MKVIPRSLLFLFHRLGVRNANVKVADSIAGQMSAFKSGGAGGTQPKRTMKKSKKRVQEEESTDDESDTEGDPGSDTSDTNTDTDTDGE